MKQLIGVSAASLIAASFAISRLFVDASVPPETLPVAMAQNPAQIEQQITQAAVGYLTKQVEKDYPPGANTSNLPSVKIEATTLAHPYALVEWFWGGMGGQALLLNKQGSWQVVLSNYGALSSSYLTKAGVPAEVTRAIVGLHQKQSLPGTTKLSANIPSRLRECIPTRQVSTAKLAGTAKKAGTAYYLLAAYPKGSEFAADLLLSTDQQNFCSLVYYNPWGKLVSLSQFAPNDVVRSLALQRLKQEIDQTPGGKTAYQEILNSGSVIPPRRTPEEVWALKQLRIQTRSISTEP